MDYRQIVRDEAIKIGLDPDIAVATMGQESGGNPSAKSPAGAYGLMQLMPGTAKELGVDPNDPIQNIQGGVRYLHQNIQKYGTAGGLAAYNAGPGRVQKTAQFSDLPQETQAYVPKIMERAAKMKDGAAPTGATPTQAQVPSLEQHYGALQKAQAAGDTDAVNEITQEILKIHEGALAKATAAGDTDAANEITEAMKPLGASQPAQATQTSSTPVNTPIAAPKAPAKAAAKPTTPEPTTFLGKVGRGADDFVRGAADALTFGYADEIAGKLDSLTGGGQSGKQSYDEAVAAQRQRDSEGGAARLAGQVAGSLVPTGVAVTAASGATKLGRIAAAAKTGAVQGALYGSGSAEEGHRLEEAGKGAVLGGVLGGAIAPLAPLTKNQTVNRFVNQAGDEAAARTDAEIIRRAQSVISDPNRMTNGVAPAISAAELNGKVTESFLREAKVAVTQLPKDFPGKKTLTDAISKGRRFSPEEIAALRGTQGGEDVATALLTAQRADKLTAALPARGGILGTIARTGVDAIPAAISAHTGIPVVVGSAVTEGVKQKLGGRMSRELVTSKMLDKRAAGADLVRDRLGLADHTAAIQSLQGMAQQAQSSAAAKVAAAKTASAQAAIGKAAAEKANKITVLQSIHKPLGGPFRELVDNGASGLGLTSEQAIDGLRLTARQFGDKHPLGRAAAETLKSKGEIPNKDTFYGLQEHLRNLRDAGALGPTQGSQGILGPTQGALSGHMQAPSGSVIHNPVSYELTVKQAGKAAEVAQAAAPTPSLQTFATTIASTKGKENKAKLLADRVANTTDQTELAFLKQFVEPLTRFGK